MKRIAVRRRENGTTEPAHLNAPQRRLASVTMKQWAERRRQERDT